MNSSFELKFRVKGRPNRARPDRVLHVGRIVVGARPLADLYVPDRLVAQEAVALEVDASGLHLDVLDALAGVHVDGRPVDGRVRVPDATVLQLGHTRIDVAIDAESGRCTLTTSEQYLPTVVDGIVRSAKIVPPPHLVDSGPQEHRWGRSRVVSVLVGGACALGLASVLSFPLLRNTEWHTRGDLADQHRIGAREDGPASCADCHAPLSSDYAARCAACHEGFADTRFHPFGAVGGASCGECHADHRGASSALIPQPVRDRETGWPRLCLTCHGVLAPAAPEPRPTRDRPGEATTRTLEIDGFSHREHRVARARRPGESTPVIADGAEVPLDCARCHVRSDPSDAAATSDFVPQTYEACIVCHADRTVPLHGRDDSAALCATCHVRTPSGDGVVTDRRTVELAASSRVWAVPPRRHDLTGDACRTCHVRDMTAERVAPAPVELAFRHDHHVAGGAVSGDEADLSKQCASCHPAAATSESLSEVVLVETSACAECHTGGEPQPVATPGRRTLADPVHGVHVAATAAAEPSSTLARGCLSCHTPEEESGRMGVSAGARDCTACHTRHANVAAGRCAFCHVDRLYEGNRDDEGRTRFEFCEQGVFDPSRPVTKTTTRVTAFEHASRGHADVACAECHPAESVDAADRVADVPWPAFDGAACARCHALERFHR